MLFARIACTGSLARRRDRCALYLLRASLSPLLFEELSLVVYECLVLWTV